LIDEDKIFAMIGGSTTGSTLAMIPVFEETQTPSSRWLVPSDHPARAQVGVQDPHTDTMACERSLPT
jgi:branched-chain amino acid transport system substrate-binding protein